MVQGSRYACRLSKNNSTAVWIECPIVHNAASAACFEESGNHELPIRLVFYAPLVGCYHFIVPSALRVPAWTAGILVGAGHGSTYQELRKAEKSTDQTLHPGLVPQYHLRLPCFFPSFLQPFLSFNPKALKHRIVAKCRPGTQRLPAAQAVCWSASSP